MDALNGFFFSLLVNHLLQGCALVLALALLLRFSRVNAASRHLAWLIALLAILLMPLMPWLTGMEPPSVQAAGQLLSVTATAPASAGNERSVDAQDIASLVESVSGMQPLGIVLLLLASGVAFKLAMLARACWYSHTLHRTSRAPDFAVELPACAKHLPRPPEVRIHDAVASPMTVGVVRPWIVFPAHMEYLLRGDSRSTADTQMGEQILVHELAHIARQDTRVLLVQAFIQALLFWHPAVCVVARKLELERELACDAWVIAHTGKDGDARKSYAANLLRLAEQRQAEARLAQTIACTPSKSQLGIRIRNLANAKVDHSAKLYRIWLATVLLGLATALGACSSAWPDTSRVDVSSLAQALPFFGDDAIDRALFRAAELGDLDTVQALVAEQANINRILRKRSPRTALNAAIQAGHQDVVQFLVESGADIDRTIWGDATPLTEAVRAARTDIATYLMTRGESPDHSSPGDGSPLIAAVRRGDTAFTELLLNAGADANLAVRGDGSPLISAAAQGRFDLVTLLVEKGADVNQHVTGEGTPLENAIASGNGEIVDYLRNRGAQ